MKLICPICAAGASLEIERRAFAPLLQNRVWPDIPSARAAPRGGLDIRACSSCGFVWNAAFDETVDIYDAAYDNDQTQSPHFRAHATQMMTRIVGGMPARRVHLVEVGCGQGAFLAELGRAARDRLASMTGFDPAWRGAQVGEGVEMHACYFGPQTLTRLAGPAEIVVSRHTIEHVPDPLGFLKAIRACMPSDSDARLFLETPDVGWILKNFQLQDLFYEHCSLFSPRSMDLALRAAGFEPIRIERVFGEQYLWAEARPIDEAARGATVSAASGELDADVAQFRARREEIVAQWRELIRARGRTQDVWLWGASSKGVTFALLVDPGAELLKGAIDINANKAGRYMPITGLPIGAPHVLRGGELVIVMNPNYRAEIERAIADMGKHADILSLGEF